MHALPRYVWRSEWIHPFESPWGIFERFKLANFATSIDVLQAFGTNEAKTYPRKKASRELVLLQGFDPRKLQHAFGDPLDLMMKAFLGRFCSPFSWGSGSEYICRDIRFCPDCIAVGFHSVFHQFNLLNSCPFHGSPLIEVCPECGKRNLYELENSPRPIPFSCKCGYTYYCADRRQYLETWLQTAKFKIQSPEIVAWLNLNEGQLQKLNHLHGIPEAFLQSGIVSLQRVLRLLESTSSQFVTKIHNEDPMYTARVPAYLYEGSLKPVFPPSILLQLITARSWKTYECLCLYQSFKTIVRHFKSTILRKHRQCIRDYVLTKRPLCVYAVAYARWRQEIEGLAYPWRADRPPRYGGRSFPPISPFTLEFATNLTKALSSTSSFKNLIGTVSSVTPTPEMWSGIFWLKCHFACCLMMSRLYDWIRYSKNNLRDAAHLVATPDVPVTYPFIIVESSEKPSSPFWFSFHYWNDPCIDDGAECNHRSR